MHGRYVTDKLKMCMKKFNAEIIFVLQIYRVLICTLRGYTVSLACSQFLVMMAVDSLYFIVMLKTARFNIIL